MKKKIFLLLVVIILFNFSVSIQTVNAVKTKSFDNIKINSNCGTEWNTLYGGKHDEWPYGIEQTYDGGYIVTGITFSYGPVQGAVWLLKTDEYGNEEWNKSYYKSGLDYGMDVLQTDDDNDGIFDDGYLVLGFAREDQHIWLIKTDEKGNMQWNCSYTGIKISKGNDLERTSDGCYIITGYQSINLLAANFDLWLIKVDEKGEMIWNVSYPLPHWDEGFSVHETQDGGFIVAGGKLFPNNFDSFVYLMKTDSSGNLEWRKYLQRGLEDDWANCIQITSDGGYALVGSAFFKTNEYGDLLWYTNITGDYFQQTDDNSYFIIGEEDKWPSGPYGYDDLKLVKTDEHGKTEWKVNMGGSEIDRGKCIQKTNDGGLILAGFTASFTEGRFNDQLWLIKFDSQINLKIDRIFGGKGIRASVKNIGENQIKNLNWSIHLESKFFHWNNVYKNPIANGSIKDLSVGERFIIKNPEVFAIGPCLIEICVGIIVVTVHCIAFGPLILIQRLHRDDWYYF